MKSCSKAHAVIGLGFGDEGKGVQVNSLCFKRDNPLIVRYSGGQQAGHTVTVGKKTHVFSNFGSGTLLGVPTYWSEYCTFDPIGAVNEYYILKDKGIEPTIFINKKCPVTTSHDKYHNRMNDFQNGTCGVGVGSTIQREEDHYSLLVEDLLCDSILKIKLEMIRDHYKILSLDNNFLKYCYAFKMIPNFQVVDSMPEGYSDYIFEGSQGLLLDQDIGFFPHVTRSSVGTRNILMECMISDKLNDEPYIYLMTRAFQTRHGNGPMTNEDKPHNIKDNPYETNKDNEFQGKFRRTLLDLDLLKYAISKDDYIRDTKNKELVITCLDLVENEYRYTTDGTVVSCNNEECFAQTIRDCLEIPKVSTIHSPSGDRRVYE